MLAFRTKLTLAILGLVLFSLPFISQKDLVNIAKDNTKVAEVGGYKVKKVKEILATDNVSIFHYYSKDCLACDKQHLEFIKLKEKLNTEIDIVGVSSSAYKDGFSFSNGDPYNKTYWDAYNELSKKMQIVGTPTVFAVDSKGNVLKQHIGYIKAEEIMEELVAN